jgi:hypothetical protein
MEYPLRSLLRAQKYLQSLGKLQKLSGARTGTGIVANLKKPWPFC